MSGVNSLERRVVVQSTFPQTPFIHNGRLPSTLTYCANDRNQLDVRRLSSSEASRRSPLNRRRVLSVAGAFFAGKPGSSPEAQACRRLWT